MVTSRLRMARSNRYAAAAVTAAALLATAGWAAAPAHSEASTDCPTSYPTDQITHDQPLSAITTVENNQHAAVQGTALGVLKDGVAPGVDMVLVRFADDSVVGRLGVWSGMSGSPVYAQDGRLIGAVAYSLGFAPSTIAGVTPAADMQRLLSDGAKPSAAPAQSIPIPSRLASRLVASGDASSAQVDQGARLLDVPFGVGGLSVHRLNQMAGLYHFGKMRVSGGLSGAATGTAPTSLAPGDSFAASMAYGTIPAAGFGTVTMVCGTEMVGFGHPMNLTGPATLTLHSSRVVTVQDDKVFSGFVVPELGDPMGKIDQDRTTGVHGVIGADRPTGAPVVSDAHSGGPLGLPGDPASHTFHADTTVTFPAIFSQIAVTSMFASQDKVLDQVSGGSGSASWTLTGTHDGTPFRLTRRDMYADKNDISLAAAIPFADEMTQLEENGVEDVTFSSAKTTSQLDRPYEKWNIKGAQVLVRHGVWRSLHDGSPVRLHAGRTALLRVSLTSRQLGHRTALVRVQVPPRALGSVGALEILGGDDSASVDEFLDQGFDVFGGSDSSESVNDLLAGFRSAPHHNDIIATLTFPDAPSRAAVPRTGKHTLSRVVGGTMTMPVRAVR